MEISLIFSTSNSQRDVINAQGQIGSNQNCTLLLLISSLSESTVTFGINLYCLPERLPSHIGPEHIHKD